MYNCGVGALKFNCHLHWRCSNNIVGRTGHTIVASSLFFIFPQYDEACLPPFHCHSAFFKFLCYKEKSISKFHSV